MLKNILITTLAAVLLCSCASSDRMTRMSGGVLDEYKAPESFRLRSEKLQAKSNAFSADSRLNKLQVAGMNDTLVNLWPLFFRSNAYWTALWPLLDYDSYGFAIRPFYNQEGDDKSILFPLSAWNTANKTGWILNFAWTEKGFGLFPLTWQHNDKHRFWCYYTPFFIMNRNNIPMSWDRCRWYKDESMTSAMLFYHGTVKHVDTGRWEWLYRQNPSNDVLMNALEYQVAQKKISMPQKPVTLQGLQQEIYKTLPVSEGWIAGLFPLFHWRHFPWDKDGGRALAYLLGYHHSNTASEYGWDFLGYLGMKYKHSDIPPLDEHPWYPTGLSKFSALCYLMNFQTRTEYKRTGDYQHILKLHSYCNQFQQNLPLIKKELKAMDPQLELPETVKDSQTLGWFLLDQAQHRSFPTASTSKGHIFPFLWYYQSPESFRLKLPMLLTFYSSYKDNTIDKSSFFSLPLLTYASHTPARDRFSVLPPLVYSSKTEHRPVKDIPIQSPDTRWSSDACTVEAYSNYALLGLFYRGKEAFYVARQKPSETELVRKNLIQLRKKQKAIFQKKDSIKNNALKAEKWVPKNKIDYHRKMIALEQVKLEEAELEEQEKQYGDIMKDTHLHAESIGFSFDDNFTSSQEKTDATIERLFSECAELRWQSDIGNGFFFRKENSHTGDWKWHFCHFLAGGEKNGTRESTHVLHMLYRHRQDGDNSETHFFPFCSIVREGKDKRISFVWRLLQISKVKGKTQGYIFFIPFH